jgi:TolB protein
MTMLRSILVVVLATGGLMAATAPPPRVALSVVRVDQQTPPQRQTQLDLTLEGMTGQPRLGLPDFIVEGDDPELESVARTVVEVLWNDLDFEKEFYMIQRSESALIPIARSREDLPLERWSQLGADFVIVGSVHRNGEQFEVELRSFAVRGRTAGEQDFGARYRGCSADRPRSCAHYIADDFHKQIRRLDGVARTKLAFVSDRDGSPLAGRLLPDPGQSKEIYISDYDGANAYRVTANRNLNVRPDWSPDGRSLAYTSWESGYQDIYVIHPFGGGPRSRPAGGTAEARNMLGTWSPDGTKLAFASTRSGSLDVWVVNRDGSGVRNLTPNTPRSLENAPTFSPNGAKIAFTSDRTGTNQLYVVDADGLTPAQRLLSNQHSDRPTWSRLNYIAFTLGGAGAQDIAIYNLATGQVSVLTDGLGANGSPSVAPNGRHIAFVTTRWGREQVAIIDYPTGGNIRRITRTGSNTYPGWSPLPR